MLVKNEDLTLILPPTVVQHNSVGFQYPRHSYLPGSACGVFIDRFFVTCDGFLAGCPLLSGPNHKRENLFDLVLKNDGVGSAFYYASIAWEQAALKSACLRCVNIEQCGGWCPGMRGGIENGCSEFREI